MLLKENRAEFLRGNEKLYNNQRFLESVTQPIRSRVIFIKYTHLHQPQMLTQFIDSNMLPKVGRRKPLSGAHQWNGRPHKRQLLQATYVHVFDLRRNPGQWF